MQMETKIAKVLDSDCRVVDLKRRKAVKYTATYLPGESRSIASHLSPLRSSSVMLGKRKKPDACKTKCRSCKLVTQRSVVHCYRNFMRSGLPERLMFYQNDEWVDHSFEIHALVKKELQDKKPYVDTSLSGYQLIFDFLHMVQLDIKTGVEQPIAWIDEKGRCFFPEIYADDDEHDCDQVGATEVLSHGPQEIKLQIDIDLNGISGSKLTEYCGESNPLVQRIKVGQEPYCTQFDAEVGDSSDAVSDSKAHGENGLNVQFHEKLGKEIDPMLRNLDSETVREILLRGMNSVAAVNVTDIRCISGSTLQGRKELFQKQIEITRKYRGDANVCYAWLASSKEALSGITKYGLGHFELPNIKSCYGLGLYLMAENCSNISSNYCDADENGLMHMVLCRVIMGKMELIPSGSKQFHPGSEIFDNGVDDLQNPRHYIVWSMNINTHIYPEYVVSFKVSSNIEGCLTGHERNFDISGVAICPESPKRQSDFVAFPVDAGSDFSSNLTSAGSKERASSLSLSSPKTPKSPWMPFPMLFSAISDKVSPADMNLVTWNYDLFRVCIFSYLLESMIAYAFHFIELSILIATFPSNFYFCIFAFLRR
ncbi:hypothetical protein Dimus_030524 [Dionaea muscipula]